MNTWLTVKLLNFSHGSKRQKTINVLSKELDLIA